MKRLSALDSIAKIVRKEHGRNAITDWKKKANKQSVEWISTGLLGVDKALGGGLPRGRIVEVYGPEGAGKTALLLKTAAQVQASGGVVAFVDAEHALSKKWAKRIGFDVENSLFSQPDYGEQALDIVRTIVNTRKADLVIVDSVAALVPKSEMDAETVGKASIGVQARMMSRALRVLASEVSKSRCVVAFVNQLRMKIGVMWGNPETTPGGNALKFYSSVRVDVRRRDQIRRKGKLRGFKAHLKVVKNKVAHPFEEADFVMDFKFGLRDSRSRVKKSEESDG